VPLVLQNTVGETVASMARDLGMLRVNVLFPSGSGELFYSLNTPKWGT
jgi:hypothetical protein